MKHILITFAVLAILSILICVSQWIRSKYTKEPTILEDLRRKEIIKQFSISTTNSIKHLQKTLLLLGNVGINIKGTYYFKSKIGRDIMSEYLITKGWKI